MTEDRWDQYFMRMAHEVGKNSKCLSRQIGAVLVRDKTIVSTGYNGVSRGIPHCENRNPNKEMVCPRRLAGYGSGKGLDMCIASHAEANAVVNAARLGIETKGTTLYCDCGAPCKDCIAILINAGIVEIVCNSLCVTAERPQFYDKMSLYLLEHSSITFRTIKYGDED